VIKSDAVPNAQLRIRVCSFGTPINRVFQDDVTYDIKTAITCIYNV